MTRSQDPSQAPAPDLTGQPEHAEQIFRERALEHYREPEQLDAMLHLTSPRLWLALGVAVAIIAAIVAWAILGSEPQEVQATGVLLPEQGLSAVSAAESGVVTDIAVHPGDEVSRGQTVGTLELRDGSTVPLTSENQGRVVFVVVERGTFVTPGALIAQLLPTDTKSDAIMFVQAGNGKLVRPGMSARISPSTAPASQYGAIEGRVLSVSDIPLSRARIEQLVTNDVVNAQIGAVGEPLLEVRVDLFENPRTRSGYRWTSGHGTPFPITDGTPLGGEIVVGSGKHIDHFVQQGAR